MTDMWSVDDEQTPTPGELAFVRRAPAPPSGDAVDQVTTEIAAVASRRQRAFRYALPVLGAVLVVVIGGVVAATVSPPSATSGRGQIRAAGGQPGNQLWPTTSPSVVASATGAPAATRAPTGAASTSRTAAPSTSRAALPPSTAAQSAPPRFDCPIEVGGYRGAYVCEYAPTYVVWPDDGHRQYFVVGTDYQIYNIWEWPAGSDKWSGWITLGGVARGPVEVTKIGKGYITIRVYGTTGSYWCRDWVSAGWNAWHGC